MDACSGRACIATLNNIAFFRMNCTILQLVLKKEGPQFSTVSLYCFNQQLRAQMQIGPISLYSRLMREQVPGVCEGGRHGSHIFRRL